MLDFDLIKLVLISAIASSIITTATVQKVKEQLSSKSWVCAISFVISMTIGTMFSYCYSELSLVNDLWAGFFTWLGADALYLAFEEKVFKPFSQMKQVTKIERTTGNGE